MKLKVGKYYRTKGGWKAIVIWEKHNSWPPFLVIHKPGSEDESTVTSHNVRGEALTTFSVNEPPRYNAGCYADLIEEWKEK